jgi:ubiquinone/menaquinone biosynthesis C-methylase UbiE
MLFKILPAFRQGTALPPLSVSMAAAKLGDRILVMGCGDTGLIAAIGAKTGLTGRTLAIDESRERCTRADFVAQKEGTLIETRTAPLTSVGADAGSFDLVIVRDALREADVNRMAAALSEAHRVLRPGGRCLVIEGSPPRGLSAIFGLGAAAPAADPITRALAAAGFAAVRTLAERDGQLFVEAIKRA